jgi:hypothetical protein
MFDLVRNPLAALSCIVLLSCLAPAAVAADEQRPDASAIKLMLTSKGPWSLAATSSSPLDPLDRWDYSAVTFYSGDAKLLMRIEYRYLGPQTPEATINEKGFRFTSAHSGDVDMVFDPKDEEHPFKGSKSMFTYWLTRRK